MRTRLTEIAIIAAGSIASSAVSSAVVLAQADQRGESLCLCGKVVDNKGAAVTDVELELIRSSGTSARAVTRSSAGGTFSLQRPQLGSGELRLRRLGYVPKSLVILFDTLAESRPVTIRLEAAPVELAAVEVEAGSSVYIREFNERRKNRGTGHFIDRAEIQKRNPAYTSDLLRTFPGLNVRISSRAGGSVRARGCRPSIFIDGIQAVGAELDDVTRPRDIDGIEIYTSHAGIPAQYSGRQASPCGAILVWTRIQ